MVQIIMSYSEFYSLLIANNGLTNNTSAITNNSTLSKNSLATFQGIHNNGNLYQYTDAIFSGGITNNS